MCGIAGLFDLSGQSEMSLPRLKAMTDAIAARGPDGEGHWRAPGVGLGHRRLAIIDPVGGQQPLIAEDRQSAVSFNGMIYNFQELRAELEEGGARFLTDCDTEVLLHGWRAWGADLVVRLDGFFAAAIWDGARAQLTLIRDRWGKKPLYYAVEDGILVFGSDTRAVLAGLRSRPAIRRDALADYLAFGYVPEPKSIFDGIERLPPAHIMCFRREMGVPSPQRYWDIRVHPERDGLGIDDAVDELQPLLRRAVEKRLIADVPLGAFLSGGVDSAAILAIASRLRGGGMTALTMGFDDAALDESALARLTAEKYGARHIIEPVASNTIGPSALQAAYSEPFADASAMPTLALCGLAARHVKVALSGDGGDELFAGYRRYPYHVAEERLKAKLPGWAGRGLFGPLARAYPALPNAPKMFRAKSTLEALSCDPMGGLFRATAIMRERERDALLGPSGWVDAYSSVDLLRGYAEQAQTDDPLARAQFVDLKTWLPGRMLVKVDRASMAAGVEVRNPLLDIELAEWAARLPTALKLDGFQGKRVLKSALEAHVPSDVLTGRKRGFVAPIGQWMTSDLAHEMERLTSQSRLIDEGLIDRTAAGKLWKQLRDGKGDTSRELWALLMLDGFVDHAENTRVAA